MNNQKTISIWLRAIMASIIVIIAVGGITRVTNSGLSMVDWELVGGVFPPMNSSQWEIEFDKYKEFPEYKNKPSAVANISEFKNIFWWEYIHRIIGRLIGILVLIPFIYFVITQKISNSQKISYFIIVLLIGLQGLLGWLMVKTGLDEETYNGVGVSPFYLAMHLGLALMTYCYVFWQYLDLKYQHFKNNRYKGFNYGIPIFVLLFFQIIVGAILSGLDGGLVSHSFPLMSSGEFYSSRAVVDFKNPFFVHFLHRWVPFLVVLIISIIYLKLRRVLSVSQVSYFRILFYLIGFQIMVGIFTVIFYVPASFAILHQLGAVFMIMLSTLLIYSFNNK